MMADAKHLTSVATQIRRSPALFQDQPCDLCAVIARAEHIYHASLTVRRIAVQLAVPSGIELNVASDIATFAFATLFSNAIDAMVESQQGTRIDISARVIDSMVECLFADDGPGIEDSIKGRIFEFGVTTKKSGGWGLHSTARALRANSCIIELVDAYSHGAAFLLRFPIAREHRSTKA